MLIRKETLLEQTAIIYDEYGQGHSVVPVEVVKNAPGVDSEVVRNAIKNQIPMYATIRENHKYCRIEYYCPVCGKQQKISYKNRREGCFCERCGQKLCFWVD